MDKLFVKQIDEIKGRIAGLPDLEEVTKQVIVLPVFRACGWNTENFEEVYPEYSAGNGRVDYALLAGNGRIFVEVKKSSENLERHQEQLLRYAFERGVPMAILTNGKTWWFYLSLMEANWEERRFLAIDLGTQDSGQVGEWFLDFMQRERVLSGESLRAAREVFHGKKKRSLILKTMPEAWKELMSGPEEELIELLSGKVEQLCGFRPQEEDAGNFLREKVGLPPMPRKPEKKFRPRTAAILVEEPQKEHPREVASVFKKVREKDDVRGRKVKSFILEGTEYGVRNWKSLLMKVAELCLAKGDFGKSTQLRGKKRPYFSRNPEEMRVPEMVKDSGIYVETNISAEQALKITRLLLDLFGFSQDDFSYEME